MSYVFLNFVFVAFFVRYRDNIDCETIYVEKFQISTKVTSLLY